MENLQLAIFSSAILKETKIKYQKYTKQNGENAFFMSLNAE